ncbi:MAG: methionine ABC transporter ATP-binding protein [Tissierellia bacterium]|nr:methionine ABC transporter ATP-binding protein [Tissierellia bacterium]
MISLKNITVKFDKGDDEIIACDNISLDVESGDIYGIVGYSGAGKSTLIRTINLLQRPQKGNVIVNGEDFLSLPEKELLLRRKKIGMIFQHFNLLKSITVFENILFPIKREDILKEEKVRKVESLLDLVGLSEYRDSYPSSLSGGQKQRVAIARALSSDPEILLCDEATSALDPKTTLEILDLLKKLNSELGLTIVLITHQMEVVKEICNKVAFMEKGKIIEKGDIVEVFGRPKSKLGKDFIDTVNHIDNIQDKIKDYEELLNIEDGVKLAKFTYFGSAATEPIVASLYSKFNVMTNILFGNIEYIRGIPIGNLVVTLTGDDEDLGKAFEYIESTGTIVELIKRG